MVSRGEVIKQFVFDEKIFTLAQLYEMLKSDYCGFENERQLILNKGRFFGNDDDYADDMAKSIVDAIYEIKGEIKFISCFFISSILFLITSGYDVTIGQL